MGTDTGRRASRSPRPGPGDGAGPRRGLRLLCAVDDGAPARAAAEVAAAIARRTGGAVTLVHAVRPPAAFALAPPSALVPAPDDLERAARAEGEALVREVTGPLAAAAAGRWRG